ncbi:hypothetical protein PHYBOEH_001206 [Phytophthora boehmeriae]|uniref:EGF-like domain-containing protein n=1 Tax=Phytophthora boehmeriae TaxID=109152 RepID=A0A8T1WTM4_9STRA|nr:hypothetical protein PHYBOEH_001206 [Phytophthora boehmeriae]
MGGNRKVLLAAGLVLVSWALLTVPTSAECPNGCSGNGACMAKDMCLCFKNYQGNDCMDRTCQFGYAHVDTPKGDLNFDLSRATTTTVLKNSQQFPEGTYEYFNPNAQTGEAHFYMECSNKGLCDRATGACLCFDGFEGVACQRATCPNKCNGRGNCESIRKFGLKAPGTLVGNPHSPVPITYDLWDAHVSYGCRCDPWYHGSDCSRRSCKVGVDPMFLSVGYAVYQVVAFHVYSTGVTFTANTAAPAPPENFFRLRLFDYHGESYLTGMIPIVNDWDYTLGTPAAISANAVINAAAVATAIKNIPNQAFSDVLCEPTGTTTGTYLSGYKTVRPTGSLGLSVVCQFTRNPGRLRTPEVAAYEFVISPTLKSTRVLVMERGVDSEWFTTDSGMTVTAKPTTATLTVTNPNSVTEATPKIFRIGSYVVVGTTATTTTTLTYPITHTLGSSTTRFNADPLSSFAVVELTLSAGVSVLATMISVTADPTLGASDVIFFENQFYKYMSVAVNGANWEITLDRPFSGNSATGGANTILKAYKVTPPGKTYQYNYVSECAGRGLCITETGICDCFKGYTNDNCDTQNILAL